MIENLKEKVGRVRKYYAENKVMPTYDEICMLFGFKSKNAAFKLVNKLVDKYYSMVKCLREISAVILWFK